MILKVDIPDQLITAEGGLQKQEEYPRCEHDRRDLKPYYTLNIPVVNYTTMPLYNVNHGWGLQEHEIRDKLAKMTKQQIIEYLLKPVKLARVTDTKSRVYHEF